MHINTQFTLEHLYLLPLLPIIVGVILSIAYWLVLLARWAKNLVPVCLRRLADRIDGIKFCVL